MELVFANHAGSSYDSLGEPLRQKLEPRMESEGFKAFVTVRTGDGVRTLESRSYEVTAGSSYDTLGEPLREWLEPLLGKEDRLVQITFSRQ